MALVPICDRCQRPGQLVTVLGREVCTAHCIPELRMWLEVPPVLEGAGRWDYSHSVLAQARVAIKAHGYASAQQIAQARGDTRRKVYDALWWLAKKGLLVHRGRGIFGEVAA